MSGPSVPERFRVLLHPAGTRVVVSCADEASRFLPPTQLSPHPEPKAGPYADKPGKPEPHTAHTLTLQNLLIPKAVEGDAPRH